MSGSNHSPDSSLPDYGWRGLYIAGGAAALLAVILCRRNLGAELMLTGGFGLVDVPPTWPISAEEWLALLQENVLVGLILFEVSDLINYGLVGLIFLALYGALRQVGKSAMVVATAFTFVGIAVYFASNQAFSMLSLSGRYAAATSEAQRAMILAAGEALLAINNPGSIVQGTGIHLSLFLVILSGLLISIVMVRSAVFNKATGYVGISANGIALGYFAALIFVPSLTWLPAAAYAPFRLAWYVLIAIRLFQLARGIPEPQSASAADVSPAKQ